MSNVKIIKNIMVPTGDICIIEGEKGPLEFLSIADYGKEKNLKADFLGLTREINGVPHGDLLPLEEKWVITVSSQYGCSMNCTFCDVPKVGPGKNATAKDIIDQVLTAVELHPEVKKTKRLNLHYARMGEPTFNRNILKANRALYEILKECYGWGFHPVISTMMPKNNKNLEEFIDNWLWFKDYVAEGEAGFQLSINSTDENIRNKMFSGNAMSLIDIAKMMEEQFCGFGIKGRKITLNFPLCLGYPIDAKYLAKLFNPEFFLCKLTPMHVTKSCQENNILTGDGYTHFYPYKETEEALKVAGFDVIVFIPSKEEDESRITCGNAILAEGK